MQNKLNFVIAYIAEISAILRSRGWPIAVLFRLLSVQAKSAAEEFDIGIELFISIFFSVIS